MTTTREKTRSMREFEDRDGGRWTATVREEQGTDYKGRYYLVMQRRDSGDEVALVDIRWNSERAARRTLETMSVVELRRRLRQATGRSASPLPR
jgi:hypothetical protein